MILGVHLYGAIGGVLGWVVYNGLYGSIMISFMHRRILKGEQWRWLFKDVLPPVLAAVTFNALIYVLLNNYLSHQRIFGQVFINGVITATTFLISALSLSLIRNIGVNKIFGYWH